MSAALTVRVDESLLARLDALAVERGATRDDIVSMALADHLSSQEALHDLDDWQLALIDEGLAAANRGDFASAEEVEAVFAKYRS